MKKKTKKKKASEKIKIFDKTLLISLIVIIVLIWGGIFLKITKYDSVQEDNLTITYIWGDKVTIKGSQHEKTKKIIIKNETDNNEIYSIKWDKLYNGFNDQSNLKYNITSTGETAAGLVESQIPNIETTIFKSVIIPPKKEHVYNINLIYNGNEKKNKFVGTIKVTSLKLEQEKQIETNKQK